MLPHSLAKESRVLQFSQSRQRCTLSALAVGITPLLLVALLGSASATAVDMQPRSLGQGDPDASPPSSSSSAMSRAQATDTRVEDLSARTASASTFANPDGTWTTEEAASPYRAKDDGGDWQDIDTTLVMRDGAWQAASSPSNVRFSAGGDDTFAAFTRPNGSEIGWAWPGALPEPSVSGSTLTYPDVVPDGDLVVTALPTGFSHSIVLYSEPHDPISIEVPVDLNGAELNAEADGAISLEAQSGKDLASAPAPLMWDADTDANGDPTNVTPVEVDIEQAGADASIVLTPDQEILSDPKTTYPVTIDPSFTTFASGDGWVSSDTTIGHTASEELRAGYSSSDNVKSRTYLKFSTTTWNDKQILDADLYLRNFGSTCSNRAIKVNRVTESINLTQVSWANQPLVTGTGSSTFAPGYGCPDGDNATWDVTDIVAGWASGSFDNYGLRIWGDDETANSWRKYRSAEYTTSPAFQPKLIVNYNTSPNQAGAINVSPTTIDSSSTHAAPDLAATLSDPDGGTVRAKFVITDGSGSTVYSATSALVSSGSVATVSVPGGVLAVGDTYHVKARANDGSSDATAWSPTESFTVSEPPPYLIGDEGDVDPYGGDIDTSSSPEDDDDLADDPMNLPTPGEDSSSYILDENGDPQYFVAPETTFAGGTWWDGVCTDGEDKYTTVKDYTRPNDHFRQLRGYARMYCGKALRRSDSEWGESAFGIRHIRNDPRKIRDFGELASWQGSTWGNWMHWAIGRTLEFPELRTVQDSIRYCYQGLFFFESPSGQDLQRRVIVILGETGVRIMTAFPRKPTYCKGPSF
jgi:hypothetical protein